jgi:hypothetical protein
MENAISHRYLRPSHPWIAQAGIDNNLQVCVVHFRGVAESRRDVCRPISNASKGWGTSNEINNYRGYNRYQHRFIRLRDYRM